MLSGEVDTGFMTIHSDRSWTDFEDIREINQVSEKMVGEDLLAIISEESEYTQQDSRIDNNGNYSTFTVPVKNTNTKYIVGTRKIPVEPPQPEPATLNF